MFKLCFLPIPTETSEPSVLCETTTCLFNSAHSLLCFSSELQFNDISSYVPYLLVTNQHKLLHCVITSEHVEAWKRQYKGSICCFYTTDKASITLHFSFQCTPAYSALCLHSGLHRRGGSSNTLCPQPLLCLGVLRFRYSHCVTDVPSTGVFGF